MYEGSYFSKFFSILVIACHFDYHHPSVYEIVYIWVFASILYSCWKNINNLKTIIKRNETKTPGVCASY